MPVDPAVPAEKVLDSVLELRSRAPPTEAVEAVADEVLTELPAEGGRDTDAVVYKASGIRGSFYETSIRWSWC